MATGTVTTIYGPARSRAIRNIWMAEELGIGFELVDVPFGPEGTRSESFLKLNPNGHVPALRDGDLVLWESLAINLYLARKHGGPLGPKDVREEGKFLMWSFWAATEVEPHGMQVLYNRIVLPEEQRDESKALAALEALKPPLHVLDEALAETGQLVDTRFTAADLNVACVLFYLRAAPDFMAQYPRVKAWYDKSMARPAAKRAFARRGD
jgi:glutathione S-transferase